MDPFLHLWDERFHAMVARNMMLHPFVPTLYPSDLFRNEDPFAWCCSHLWLHKQPLFMWQMALSMKIFGISTFSMRLPSAIMGTLMVLILYRIVILLFENKSVALLSALLLACSQFYLQLISGVRGMDHNDIAHSFYILASVWAFAEYYRAPKWYWVVLIGVFSGGAVLNKWLTGLFVFLIWGLYLLIKLFQTKKGLAQFIPLFVSVIVSCAVFLPWQIYILTHYHELAMHEYKFNSRHILEAIEGHKDTVFYYFLYLYNIVGMYIYWLILPGLFLMLRSKNGKIIHWALALATMLVFVFYSAIVQTKIQAYLLFIIPFLFICIAFSIDFLFQIVKKAIFLKVALLCVLIFCMLRPLEIKEYLLANKHDRMQRIHNAEIFKNLRKKLPKDIKIVMNLGATQDLECMFYNPGILAYTWSLSQENMKILASKKIRVGFFAPHAEYGISSDVQDYPYLYIIDEKLETYSTY